MEGKRQLKVLRPPPHRNQAMREAAGVGDPHPNLGLGPLSWPHESFGGRGSQLLSGF